MKGKRFTEKEQQIAELVVMGLTNQEIAVALDRKRCTVKAFVEKLLSKTGAKNRTHFAYMLGCQNYDATSLDFENLI
ncbi:MAG: helix-turn-helix transcriptional regulator [Fusobacterium sp.]|nr:helix-turn-helix transcriptional regulator [Fusobacterium sp.]